MIRLTYRTQTLLLIIISTIFSFAVLNRWIVTDLGMLSYGRIWQLFINYSDFGFTRRAFIGTLLSITPIHDLFKNEYIFALFVHHAAIALLSILIALHINKTPNFSFSAKAALILSPALIIQSSYSTGSLDVFVLIIAAINILYVKNIYILSFSIFAGILTHELFIFTIPAQFASFFIKQNLHSRDLNRIFKVLWIPTVTTVISVAVLALFGKTNLQQTEFENIMKEIIPGAAYDHGLWSGYREVGSTFEENARSISLIFTVLTDNIVYIIVPIIYVILLIKLAAQNAKNRTVSIIVIFSSLFPLLAYLVATDLYRWIGMSANMAILLLLVIGSEKPLKYAKWHIVALALFVILAPFGGAELNRPFPMHQFILERIP